VISMGASSASSSRTGCQGLIAYMTSGNIAVFDHECEVRRLPAAPRSRSRHAVRRSRRWPTVSTPSSTRASGDTSQVQGHRASSGRARRWPASRYCWRDNARFLNSFYQTGKVKKDRSPGGCRDRAGSPRGVQAGNHLRGRRSPIRTARTGCKEAIDKALKESPSRVRRWKYRAQEGR
jgi:hypothetical protein